MHRLRSVLLAGAMVLPGCVAQRPAVAAQGSDLQQGYAAAQRSLAAGDLEGARRQFAALSRAHPEVAELHATLGALLFQAGDFPGSLNELEQARKLKPSLPNLDGLIAMSNAELGHYDVSVAPLEQTFRTATEAAIKRQSGLELERAYTATGQDAKAVGVALELQRIFPDDPEVLYHNERIFGNFAFLTVQNLVKAAPESVWRYLAQAEADESQGSHDAALSAYGKVLALDPHHPGVHYKMGRARREKARDSHHPEDLQLAMTEFETELKMHPENANAAYEIGELDRISGKLPEAKSSFAAALRTFPDFPEANLGMGMVLASMNQPMEALAYLKRAADLDPLDQTSWYYLARVERVLGHKEGSAAALKRFLDLREAGAASPARPPERDITRPVINPEDTP